MVNVLPKRLNTLATDIWYFLARVLASENWRTYWTLCRCFQLSANR
jgi:hypothetical protein